MSGQRVGGHRTLQEIPVRFDVLFYFKKGDMKMRDFKKQLKEWEKKHGKAPAQKKKVQPQPKKKRAEKLSNKELKELMGMNQKGYHRGKGGAFRQR